MKKPRLATAPQNGTPHRDLPKAQLSGTSALATFPHLATIKLTLLGISDMTDIPVELQEALATIVQKLSALIGTSIASGTTESLIDELDQLLALFPTPCTNEQPLSAMNL